MKREWLRTGYVPSGKQLGHGPVRPQQEVRAQRERGRHVGKVTRAEDGGGNREPEVEPVWPVWSGRAPGMKVGRTRAWQQLSKQEGAGRAETARNIGVARRWCRASVGRAWRGHAGEGPSRPW